MKSGIWEGAF